ncbi:MAG: tripartite tricarboxylate transporter permease [bacterium]|nr:tripartite tricarboxylate transporter permease [bacterium]
MTIIIFVLIGVLTSSLFSLIPALHIYNIIAFLTISTFIDPLWLTSIMLGMIIGFSIVNTIPSIFLGAPDESAAFLVLPGHRYMLQGRGHEACLLSGIGSLLAIFAIIPLIPLLIKVVPLLRVILYKNSGWVIGAVIVYVLISEWPKGGDRGRPGYKFIDAWKSLGAGILTFCLSGFIGMILFYKPITPVERGFQNLMPAFIGLFAIPWVTMNILLGRDIPTQNIVKSMDVKPSHLLQSLFSGMFGGLFAAIVPGVTGGVGGLLAGHATAQRDDRIFIISQGVSKTTYYVGAFMLFLVPGLSMRRGGLAWMASIRYTPSRWCDFYHLIAGCLLGAILAFFLLDYFAKRIASLIDKYTYKRISWAGLITIIALVLVMTGPMGLIIAGVSTGIGLIPILFNSRRLNCLGVILVPICLNLTGIGPSFAKFLGLI